MPSLSFAGAWVWNPFQGGRLTVLEHLFWGSKYKDKVPKVTVVLEDHVMVHLAVPGKNAKSYRVSKPCSSPNCGSLLLASFRALWEMYNVPMYSVPYLLTYSELSHTLFDYLSLPLAVAHRSLHDPGRPLFAACAATRVDRLVIRACTDTAPKPRPSLRPSSPTSLSDHQGTFRPPNVENAVMKRGLLHPWFLAHEH